jgi:lysophospholipase L1-like esterase
MVSPWSGKRLGVFGDSISALFNNAWQNIVLTQNSMTLGFQDAHAGRTTYSLFENYGGDGLGTTTGDASAGGMTTGTTLAQDLANVDLLIIEIGTNDNNSGFPLGSPTDAPASPGLGASNISLCAAWNYILNTLQAANPNMRIVWAGPYSYNPLNGHGGGPVAQNAAIAAAQQTVMGQHGVPYLNALSEVGFNAQNWSVMLGDGLHPSAAGFVRYGGYIAQKIKQFP